MKLIGIFVLAAAAFGFSCRPAAAPVSISNRPIQPGSPKANIPSKPLGEMEWTTLDGTTAKLGDLKGKAVILDFWATNCPPCREEIPHLNSLLAKHGPENLMIIGLNVGGEEDLAIVPKFRETTRIDYPIAVPEDALNRFMFAESDVIPQTAIFDRNGRLLKKFIGYSPSVNAELDSVVDAAVGRN